MGSGCPSDAFSEYGSRASSTHYKCISTALKESEDKQCLRALKPVKRDINCYMEIIDKCGKFETFEDHTACIEKNLLKFSCDCAEIFVGRRDQCAQVMRADRGAAKNKKTKGSAGSRNGRGS